MKKLNKVIIIDDNRPTVYLHRLALEELNLTREIIEFVRPPKALEYLESCILNNEFPELILLDLSMPEMDGIEFLERLSRLFREKKAIIKTIIVPTSCRVDFEIFDKLKAFEAIGVVEHIPKPIDKNDLTTIMRAYFSE